MPMSYFAQYRVYASAYTLYADAKYQSWFYPSKVGVEEILRGGGGALLLAIAFAFSQTHLCAG